MIARAGDEQLARLLVGDQVELAAAKARLDVGQAVVLLRRRAQRLREQRERRRRAATARRGACGSRPRRRRSGRRGRARAAARSPSSPSSSTRACSWIRPERSTRSRNAIFALPAARREPPGDAVRDRRLLARPRGLVRGAHRRDRLDALGTRAGTARRPRRAARRASARRAAKQVRGLARPRPLIAATLLQPTSILVIFSCAPPRGAVNTTVSPRLRPSSALPTGDSLESLFSAGLASAEPTIVYRADLPVFSSLTWTTEPTATTSVRESRRPRSRSPMRSFSSTARSAPRASPARSWRRRTRRSRRCRRTRGPP